MQLQIQAQQDEISALHRQLAEAARAAEQVKRATVVRLTVCERD